MAQTALDNKNPIYDYLKSEGQTTLSESDFITKYSDRNNLQGLYDFFKSEGQTELDFTTFADKYFPLPKSNEDSTPGSENTSQTSTEPLPTSLETNVTTLDDGFRVFNVTADQEENIGEIANNIQGDKWAVRDSKGDLILMDQGSLDNGVTFEDVEFRVKNGNLSNNEVSILNTIKNSVAQIPSLFNQGVYSVPEFAYNLFASPQNFLGDLFNAPWMKADYRTATEGTGLDFITSDIVDDAQKNIDFYNSQLGFREDGIVSAIGNGNWSEAGNQLANAVIQTIPSMLSMSMTGSVSRWKELGNVSKTMLNSLPFMSSNYQEVQDNANLSEFGKLGVSALNGLAEMIPSQAFGTGKLIDDIITGKAGQEALKTIGRDYVTRILASNGVPASVVRGGLEEAVTQFSQNVINKYSGATPDIDLKDGILDAFIVGSVADGALSGGAKLASKVLSRNQSTKVENLEQEVTELQQDLNNKNLDDSVTEAIQEEIVTKVEEINTEIEESRTVLSNLSPTQLQRVQEISTEMDRISDLLNPNPNVENTTPSLSNATRSVLEQQQQELSTELDNIIQNTNDTETVEGQEISDQDVVLYHGTPHTFSEFKLQNIGTGEGNQAFGHGLYFTNDKSIAENYANEISTNQKFWEYLENGNDLNLTKDQFDFINSELDALGYDGEIAENHNLTTIKVDGVDVEGSAVYDALSQVFKRDFAKNGKDNYGLTQEEFDKLLEIKKTITNPQLLEVEIPANLNLVSWEANVSENIKGLVSEYIDTNKSYTGQELYNELSESLGGQEQASTFLESKGIDGLVYKSNRGTGGQSGTGRNYVFFSDTTPLVTKINEQPTGNIRTKTSDTSISNVESDLNNDQPEIEGTVPTPSEQKIVEIRTRREEIRARIRSRLGDLNAGLNPEQLADMLALGSTYVEEGIVRFSDWVNNLKEDVGEKAFKKLKQEDLRELYQLSAEANGLKVRGFTESARKSPKVSEATQEVLDATNDEVTYTPQVLAELETNLNSLPEQERLTKVQRLGKVTSIMSENDNDAVLAGISLINQYEAEGRHEESAKIIQDMAKSATVFAQALRQYGEFKNSTPQGYMALLEGFLKEKGKELNSINRGKIETLYANFQKALNDYNIAYENNGNVIGNQTRKEYLDAEKVLEKANRELSDYIAKIYGKDLGETLASILQGNLLTVKSLIINPFSNLVQSGVRFTQNLASWGMDSIFSAVMPNLPSAKISPFDRDAVRLGLRATKEGLNKAGRKAWDGDASTELNKYDVRQRLKPFDAFRDLLNTYKSEDFNNEFSVDMETTLSNIAESTIGVPANLMFRMLPFGDDPFFNQAYTEKLVEIGKKNKNLTGEALEKFVNKPDEVSQESAKNYAREATFQDPTKLATAIRSLTKGLEQVVNSGTKSIPYFNKFSTGITKVVVKAIVPFVGTPSSILLKTLRFANPIFPMMHSGLKWVDFYKALKAYNRSATETNRNKLIDSRRSLVDTIGETIVATSAMYVALTLVTLGLVSGDMPDEKEQAKERNFGFASMPFNHINVSGLKRLLKGEDPTYQQGDVTKSYIALGVLGAQIGIVEKTLGAKLREDFKKSKVLKTSGEAFYNIQESNSLITNYFADFYKFIPASSKYFMNQSFVQSTETMLETISTGEFDQFGNQMVRTLSNIGIPNQASQFFRASNEYMRDIYTEEDLQTWTNIVKEKLGKVEDLPIRYDIWGKPVKQSPEGTNPYVYQMLDIFRSQEILRDDITYKVFDLYKKTHDNGVIPTGARDFFSEKDFTIKLDKPQRSELTRLVGEQRYLLAQKVLKNYTKDSTNPDKYVKLLKRAYSDGAKRGKKLFLKQLREQGIDIKTNVSLKTTSQLTEAEKLEMDN